MRARISASLVECKKALQALAATPAASEKSTTGDRERECSDPRWRGTAVWPPTPRAMDFISRQRERNSVESLSRFGRKRIHDLRQRFARADRARLLAPPCRPGHRSHRETWVGKPAAQIRDLGGQQQGKKRIGPGTETPRPRLRRKRAAGSSGTEMRVSDTPQCPRRRLHFWASNFSTMSRMANTVWLKAASRCISRAGRSGLGTSISLIIVPGAPERM